MHLDVAALTDRGRRRRRNEDAVLCAFGSRLFAVADGMGGHAGGEVASTLAIATLAASLHRPPAASPRHALAAAFADANHAVYERSLGEPQLRGMGTTLTALLLAADGTGWLAHIGDSRGYRLRRGRLRRLTRDHTWVQEQVEAGRLPPHAADRHPMSNIITRALGIEPDAEPELRRTGVRAGDGVLLCTDGLIAVVDEAEIAAAMAASTSAETCVRDLVELANARGGPDNVTAIVIRAARPA
jgi:PPM family protein phosphatase